MLLDALQKAASVFPRRFLFNALLPTFLFTSVSCAVVAYSVTPIGRIVASWSEADLLSRLLLVLVYIAAIWFLSAAVASQWRGIVRLFEGYPLVRWSRRLGRATPGVKWHQARLLNTLSGSERRPRSDFPYYEYPGRLHAASLLPTRVGNTLLAAERYPLDRYGVDPIVFWPRLFPLMPEHFRLDFEEFVQNYQFPLVVSFQAAVATVVTSAAALWGGAAVELFLACLLTGSALSASAYFLALSSVEEFGEQQRAAFDLYRNRVLAAWPTVDDVQDEKEAFKLIQAFVLVNAPPFWREAQERHENRREPEPLHADGPENGELTARQDGA